MKRLKPVGVSIVIGFIAMFLLAIYFNLGRSSNSDASPVLPVTSKTAVPTKDVYYGLPTKLGIPAIEVDTNVEYIGLTNEGDMASPNDSMGVGWYRFGTIPGDKGSAVVAGHVVGSKGEPGVFYNLKKLKTGDDLSITDGKGQIILFKVREIRAYKHNEQHDEVFNSQDLSHLNIITCAGDYDVAQQKYLERLVVFADKTN